PKISIDPSKDRYKKIMQTDFIKIVLWSALFGIALMLWNAWHLEHQIEKVPTQVVQSESAQNFSLPSHQQGVSNLPSAAQKPIQIQTDVFKIAINPVGGNLVDATLLKYPEEENTHKAVNLLNSDPKSLYFAQSNIMGISPLIYKTQQQVYG